VYRAGGARLASSRGRVILEDLLDEYTESRLVLDPVRPPGPLPGAWVSPKDESDGFTFASCGELWKTREEKVLLERLTCDCDQAKQLEHTKSIKNRQPNSRLKA
jgi:hypothetical protein